MENLPFSISSAIEDGPRISLLIIVFVIKLLEDASFNFKTEILYFGDDEAK